MIAVLAALALAAATEPATETRIASFVSREKALATVRELVALGPRMGGTASGNRAAAMIADRMKELGLSVEVIDDPAKAIHEETRWRLALGDKELVSAWPYGFSPALALATAPLVVESSQVIPEAAQSMKGAVVLTGRSARQAYASALAAGAIALLTDSPGDPNRYQDWAPIGSLEWLGRKEASIPVFGLSYNDGKFLRDLTAPKMTISLESTIGEGKPRTVVGTMPGTGARSGEILMVCAHGDSDSGGPGADDNASGVATVIEVARALTAAATAGLLPKDRPSILFAVWGSEYHSSEAWVAAKPASVRQLQAVINFDETGVGAERDAVYYEGNDVPFLTPLLRVIESVADDFAGKEGFPTTYTSVPSQGGTDAYVFLPRKFQGIGIVEREIPSTTIFTAAWDKPSMLPRTPGWNSKGWTGDGNIFVDYSAVYHSSGDTPDRTTEREPWNMERCARLTAVTIVRLMGQAPAPQSR